MSGTQWAVLLGIGGPLLILASAAVVGLIREHSARDADPGPLRVLHRGYFTRLRIGLRAERVAELTYRISQRRGPRAAWFKRGPRP